MSLRTAAAGTALGGWKIVKTMGHKDLPVGAGARLRYGDFGGSGHHRRFPVRRAHQHDAYHHGLHFRRRVHETSVRRALGRGRKPGHRVDFDHSRPSGLIACLSFLLLDQIGIVAH